MVTQEIKRLKKKLPARFGKVISEFLNDPAIDARKVVLVFNGQITNPEIVEPVLGAAIAILQKSKKIKNRVAKALKAA